MLAEVNSLKLSSGKGRLQAAGVPVPEKQRKSKASVIQRLKAAVKRVAREEVIRRSPTV